MCFCYIFDFLFDFSPSETTANLLTVRCGEWDVKHENEPLPHQDRRVSIITIHPRFNPISVDYDFAVLSLVEDFVLGPNIDTICLPSEDATFDDYLTDACVATGWGVDSFGKLVKLF